jgi:HlyD family secretion protein
MSSKFFSILGVVLLAGSWSVYEFLRENQEFMYAGTLDTTKVILSSKIGADVISLPIVEGMQVKKGDVVAKLNDEPFVIAARQLDSDYRRCMVLVGEKVMPVSDVDKIRRSKEENDLHIRECEIHSPIDGIVITKFKEEGEYIGPGMNLLSISNPSEIYAVFYVPYDMIHNLRIGDKVSGILQEAPGKTFNGVIVKINEEAEFTPKNVQTREERTRLIFGVKVRFDNDNLELKSGMSMETSFGR